jgi:hypothetical protein
VGLEVKCRRDCRVAEALLGDLGMNALAEELGRVAVPEIVKSDSRKILHPANEMGELVGEALRLK